MESFVGNMLGKHPRAEEEFLNESEYGPRVAEDEGFENLWNMELWQRDFALLDDFTYTDQGTPTVNRMCLLINKMVKEYHDLHNANKTHPNRTQMHLLAHREKSFQDLQRQINILRNSTVSKFQRERLTKCVQGYLENLD